MSASLVGSEMCIRDSHSSVHKCSARLNTKCVCMCAFVDVVTAAECAGAVSYTHLTLPTICSV
eukprot:5989913-Alexandrium_andersonii.AAC.1